MCYLKDLRGGGVSQWAISRLKKKKNSKRTVETEMASSNGDRPTSPKIMVDLSKLQNTDQIDVCFVWKARQTYPFTLSRGKN